MSAELEVSDFSQLDRAGFQLVSNVLSEDDCDVFSGELSALFDGKRRSGTKRIGGLRNLLSRIEKVRDLAFSLKLISQLSQSGGRAFFPVRAIFFDKTSETNWRVPWHQDLAIAVNRRVQISGFQGWSLKEGVPHVVPPAEILSGMLTVRIHLDACDASNGALRVIPGSHAFGKLNSDQEWDWIRKGTSFVCAAKKGDALLMRPLLLHASSSSENPKHRRVLHLEYASQDLPNGLEWYERGIQPAKPVFVALGSNLGNSRRILTEAMARLQEFSTTPLVKSSITETAPVDCPPGSANFLNAVVGLNPKSGETPETLLAKLQALEKEFGRQPKKILNEARPLDLDLIAFGCETRARKELTLPHPRAHLRRFVLEPLAEIAPDFILPGQAKTVAQLLASLPA